MKILSDSCDNMKIKINVIQLLTTFGSCTDMDEIPTTISEKVILTITLQKKTTLEKCLLFPLCPLMRTDRFCLFALTFTCLP